MKTKYIAWCKKEYLNLAEYGILDCMLDCVEYGVGDSENDRITAETSRVIYQDEKYIVTEDADGYCYLLAVEESQEETEIEDTAVKTRWTNNMGKTLDRMEKGTLYRTIYKIEGITEDGELVFRLFARNKKTAEKIKRKHMGGRAYYIGVELVPKFDHQFIFPWDVD